MYDTPEIGTAIIRQMMHDITFAQKYLPTFRAEFFQDHVQRLVFTNVASYIKKYKVPPSKEQLIIDMNGLSGHEYDREHEEGVVELLNAISDGIPESGQWIVDQTEAFIRERFEHALILDMIFANENGQSVVPFATKIQNPPSFDADLSALGLDSGSPDILRQLRAMNMNKEAVIPFDVDWLNRTIQGVRRKTLNMILAGTNCGKSLVLCHLAAAYARQGLNVLYVTLEMDEQMTANRIYANLLNIPLKADSDLVYDPDAVSLPKGLGRIVVKAFDTGAAHTGIFRAHLAKLKTQADFIPDIIMVDYLAICSSERMNNSINQNHIVVGSISKELRALGQQTNSVVWTASQMNRPGMAKGVHGNLTNTAGSIELTFDADLIISLSHDEKLPDRYHCTIEKRRNGSGAYAHTVIGVDKSRMRIYDLAEADAVAYQTATEKISTIKAKKRLKVEPVFEIDLAVAA